MVHQPNLGTGDISGGIPNTRPSLSLTDYVNIDRLIYYEGLDRLYSKGKRHFQNSPPTLRLNGAPFLPHPELNDRTPAIYNFTVYLSNGARLRPIDHDILEVANQTFENNLTSGQINHISGYGTQKDSYKGLNNLRSQHLENRGDLNFQ